MLVNYLHCVLPLLKNVIITLNIRVKCHFRPCGLTSFATFVQRFVFSHLDPKGLKSCQFHPAR
ncbi:hypothetical protein HanPSC8_Chr06g0232741 [Helianthus annuus]|nr:hypothetical protein HanPSC8_Chr06g0232741 [Helianthus annuus]